MPQSASCSGYIHIWPDRVSLQTRMDGNAECMLVLIGATPEGKKKHLGFDTWVPESAQS